MQYTYRVTDRSGNVKSGREEAESKEELILKLRSQGKVLLEIKEHSSSPLPILKEDRLSRQERYLFIQQLAGLLDAGIPLEKVLGILTRLSFKPETKKVVGQLRRSLQEGLAFSVAMERQPRQFPSLFVNMARAGETGGIMPQVLKKLARYLEEEISLRRFIVGSLFYPGIIMVASIAVILFFVGKVVPEFQTIFEDMGSELPFVTKLVIFLGKGLQNFWWLILGGIGAAIIWLVKEWATSEGKYRIDRFLLQLPLLGQVLLKVYMARMALAFSLLSGSGVPIITGLKIAGEIVENKVLKRALQEVGQEIGKGNTLAKSMAEKGVFPVLAVEMIGVGEESGNLGPMMEQIARTYEGEVRHSMNIFISIFEPLLILLMVGIIALLAMAVLLPIINMNNQINILD